MKKEEKTELTKERIKASALSEFGTVGYDGVTLNAMCSKHNISKGLLYHNFKGKNDLYLECLNMCFRELTECIKENFDAKSENPEEKLKSYFSARLRFFHSNPLYLRIFCDAVMYPPSSLTDDIKRIKKEFEEMNTAVLTSVIDHLELRPEVKRAEVIDTFRQYQDFINARYREPETGEIDFKSHEERCYKALDVLLYGVVRQ